MASDLGDFKVDLTTAPQPGQRERVGLGRSWSADDLFDFKESPWRHELIDGELYRMAPTGIEHGRVENRFGFLLSSHVFANRLGDVLTGETGFIVSRSPDTVLAADVAFIARERLGQFEGVQRFSPYPADLVAEVASPGDRPAEMLAKTGRWLDFGVKAVVVIQPRSRSVTVYQSLANLQEYGLDETVDLGFVVPGFRLKVADLFP